MTDSIESENFWQEKYPYPISPEAAGRVTENTDVILEYLEQYVLLVVFNNKQVITAASFMHGLFEMDELTERHFLTGLVASYNAAYEELQRDENSVPKITVGVMLRYIGKLASMGTREAIREYFRQRAEEIAHTDDLGWSVVQKVRECGGCNEVFDMGAVIFYDLMDEWKADGEVDMGVWGKAINGLKMPVGF